MSRKECETKETHLRQLSQQLGQSEMETARLLAELETFRREAEQMARLRSKVAEQDEEKRNHLLAIDEANERIKVLQMEIDTHNQTASKFL